MAEERRSEWEGEMEDGEGEEWVETAGHCRTFVQDWKALEGIVESIVAGRGTSEAAIFKKALALINKYQEEGQLLEPHLEAMIPPLMLLVRERQADADLSSVRRLCSVVHALMTVCGHKVVVKFFPHQAADLEPAVSLLQRCLQQDGAGPGTGSSLREESTGVWETQCTLLLWLSILVLIPFDMASVDTMAASSAQEASPMVRTVVSICQDLLHSPGAMRELAGLLLARLLTRPDMAAELHAFVAWSEDALQRDAGNVFLVTGVASALVAIFKLGGRDVLLPVAAVTWQQARTLAAAPAAKQSALLRKLLVKLIQRIGLTYLLPRQAAWRYLRGHRSMPVSFLDGASSLPGTDSSAGSGASGAGAGPGTSSQARVSCSPQRQQEWEPKQEEMEVPQETEEVVEQLLAGLRDKDTVVRWSAAKGIGRVTGRLTSDLADEVVASVLELFRAVEGDGAWHGGCLALAELARRGLLLPDRLPTVVPVIVKALHYDVRRGPHSVGSHVRDAAAYVCWAFARAYSSEFMQEHLRKLAPALLSIACYDREVNCRRAAAAAFQECVGRQGSFPNGIDLVNAADFFALGSRSNAYRSVAMFVAQFHEYRVSLIDELLYTKIQHWEKSLRELAAEALAMLVIYDPPHFAGPVLDALLSWILSSDLTLRHGATLGTAEVVTALHRNGVAMPAGKQKAVAEIVLAIEKARLYRGKGGEIMRGAVCRLLECVCIVGLSLAPKVEKAYHDTIDENLKHPNGSIQVAAVAALKAFLWAYFIPVRPDSVAVSTEKYLRILKKDPNAAARRGAALAFSALPHQLVQPLWEDVLATLCSALLDTSLDGDAETRVNAVRGLCVVCETLFQGAKQVDGGVAVGRLREVVKSTVMDTLLDGLDDYAVDNRGDVGSWVREASMEALERCSNLLCDGGGGGRGEEESSVGGVDGGEFDVHLGTRVVGGLAKQAAEKIDRVRDVAGKSLQRLLHSDRIVHSSVPHRARLAEMIPPDPRLNWASPGDSFPRIVQLLGYPEYRQYVLSGLVISIGGLADSLAKASLQSLLQLLRSGPDCAADDGFSKEPVEWLGVELVLLLETYAGNDRVIIPAFKTMDILFSKRVLVECEQSSTLSRMLGSITREVQGTKDVAKLLLAINILTHLTLMHHEPMSTDALIELLALLAHRYPKVRKVCAEQVYLLFLQSGDQFAPDADSLEYALELVTETCWDGPVESIKDDRDKLIRLFQPQDQAHMRGPAMQ